jgi:Zn-dependent M28 family amino/carboxypeptidase
MRRAPPPRTTLFLLFAAEEEGALGSAHWVAQPPWPLARTVAAVNVDAGAPLAPPTAWIIEGGGEPRIAAAAARVTAAHGWKTTPAPLQPNSDHWPFAARGVPAAFPVPDEGWEGLTREQEEALIARWWRAHHPDDEWSPEFPLAGLRRHAEFIMALGRALATP